MEPFYVIERILRNRGGFFDEIRDGDDLGRKTRNMLVGSVLFFAIYGAVLGISNSLLQALASAIKLPILYLITLAICLPTLYFFNLLFGSRLTLAQTFALIMTAIAVTSILTLSFAPIALFFWLTAPSYDFYKLLNVGILTVTGVAGLSFLWQGMRHVHKAEGMGVRNLILWLWIFVYGFVGTQMAWTLRPFFGAPGLPFEVFRDLGGNFYMNIVRSIISLLVSLVD
jgi:hypothetical protein